MGLDFDQLFPGRFLKAGMFQGRDVTLTISEIKVETLEGEKGKEVRGILSFREKPQQLVLNKTNGLCLRGMFGRDTEKWIGKRITFFPAPIDFGDAEIAIRVRGSPDLPAPMEVEIKLARKKPKKMRMEKTGQQQRPANGAAKGGQQRAAPVAQHSAPSGPPEPPPSFDEPPADFVLPGQDGYDPATGEVADGVPHS